MPLSVFQLSTLRVRHLVSATLLAGGLQTCPVMASDFGWVDGSVSFMGLKRSLSLVPSARDGFNLSSWLVLQEVPMVSCPIGRGRGGVETDQAGANAAAAAPESTKTALEYCEEFFQSEETEGFDKTRYRSKLDDGRWLNETLDRFAQDYEKIEKTGGGLSVLQKIITSIRGVTLTDLNSEAKGMSIGFLLNPQSFLRFIHVPGYLNMNAHYLAKLRHQFDYERRINFTAYYPNSVKVVISPLAEVNLFERFTGLMELFCLEEGYLPQGPLSILAFLKSLGWVAKNGAGDSSAWKVNKPLRTLELTDPELIKLDTSLTLYHSEQVVRILKERYSAHASVMEQLNRILLPPPTQPDLQSQPDRQKKQ
ncbi:MAG: hypothetical protein ACR2PT_05130 [Endozoicomonas sp.]